MINHSQPPGHNRNYWNRPIQSDRLRPDYGNTRLQPMDEPRAAGGWRGFLIILLFVAGASALFAWATLSR